MRCLTVVRMLPVALSLLGAGFDRLSVAFIGWFGPRGLASVIFALLALEDLHDAAEEVVATIALTVLLSVVAHGSLPNRSPDDSPCKQSRRHGIRAGPRPVRSQVEMLIGKVATPATVPTDRTTTLKPCSSGPTSENSPSGVASACSDTESGIAILSA